MNFVLGLAIAAILLGCNAQKKPTYSFYENVNCQHVPLLYKPVPTSQGEIESLVIIFNTIDENGVLEKAEMQAIRHEFRGLLDAFKGREVVFMVVVRDTAIDGNAYMPQKKFVEKAVAPLYKDFTAVNIQYILVDEEITGSGIGYKYGMQPGQFVQDYVHPCEANNGNGASSTIILQNMTKLPDHNVFGERNVELEEVKYSLYVNDRLARQNGICTTPCPLYLEGGNILFIRDKDKDIAIVGSYNIVLNRELIPGEPMNSRKYQGQDVEIAQKIRKQFNCDSVIVIPNYNPYEETVSSAERNTKNYLAHLDMFMTPAGLTKDGKTLMLIGEMDEKYTELLQFHTPEFIWPEWLQRQKKYLDSVAKLLPDDKFQVVRLPMPVKLDIHGSSGTYIMSYNNSLVEEYQGKKRIILPSYIDEKLGDQANTYSKYTVVNSVDGFLVKDKWSALKNTKGIIAHFDKQMKFNSISDFSPLLFKKGAVRDLNSTNLPVEFGGKPYPYAGFSIEKFEKDSIDKFLSPYFQDIITVQGKYNAIISRNMGSLHCLTKVIRRRYR